MKATSPKGEVLLFPQEYGILGQNFPESAGIRKDVSMKIVLVGGGKVGTALARQLSEEGHNVTVVDTNKARVEHIGESYDVMSILGNGSSITTLSEAGVEDADVLC